MILKTINPNILVLHPLRKLGSASKDKKKKKKQIAIYKATFVY